MKMFKYYSNIQMVVFGPKYSNALNTTNIPGNTVVLRDKTIFNWTLLLFYTRYVYFTSMYNNRLKHSHTTTSPSLTMLQLLMLLLSRSTTLNMEEELAVVRRLPSQKQPSMTIIHKNATVWAACWNIIGDQYQFSTTEGHFTASINRPIQN